MKHTGLKEQEIKDLIDNKYKKLFSERYYLQIKRKLILENAEKYNTKNKKKK